MFPRPFHRWKSFWLGLLVLVFLGWSWVMSVRYFDSFSWGDRSIARGVIVRQKDSQVELAWTRKSAPANLVPRGWSHLRLKHPELRKSRFFPAAFSSGHISSEWFGSAAVAHWFLILLFLVPWAGFLVWRVRRMKAGSAEPLARRST